MQLSIKFSIWGVFYLVASFRLNITTGALVLKGIANISFEQQMKVSDIINNQLLEEKKRTDMKSMDDPIKLLSRTLSPKFNGKAHFDGLERWLFDESSNMNTHTDMKQYKSMEVLDNLIKLISEPSSSKFNSKTKFHYGVKRHFSLLTDLIENTPEKEPPIPQPDTRDAPDICKDDSIDTATRTGNVNTYLFKGDFYWKILNESIADGYPQKIADDWDGLEGNLDASLTWSNGRTYFFKGKSYWRFRNEKMDPGYPKLISQGVKGIPDNLAAAVVWSGNGATYFFKGDKYWRFESLSDTPVNSDYPSLITLWKGLPNDSIDAAIQLENKNTYFFKDGKYTMMTIYEYNDVEDKVEISHLTSVMWFGCQPKTEVRSVNHQLTTERKPVNYEPTIGEITEIRPVNHEPTTEGIPVKHEPTTEEISVKHETITKGIPVKHETTTKGIPVKHEATTEGIPVKHETTTKGIPVTHEPTTERIPGNHETTAEEIPVRHEKASEGIPVNHETITEEILLNRGITGLRSVNHDPITEGIHMKPGSTVVDYETTVEGIPAYKPDPILAYRRRMRHNKASERRHGSRPFLPFIPEFMHPRRSI